MKLDPVAKLLKERIGLAPESLGASVLPRVVAARMQALGVSTFRDYAARLAGDAAEFQTLVSGLTVPETWFFRGGELFTYLARYIARALKTRPAEMPYRALSVPCCSGEEPYSLAIALMAAAVPSAAWSIEGVDLDVRLVERARLGQYGELSFRETPPELRQRYFRPSADSWQLEPAVRSMVRFRQGNLLAPFFLAGGKPFDLIFCRNLFIYLHAAARRRALATLDQLLAPKGLLCMGHAEPLEDLDARFERIGPRGGFLYHRRAGAKNEDLSPPQVRKLRTAQPMQHDNQTPLAPVLRGEGLGVRGKRLRQSNPLTPTLSPEYRGEGESKSVARSSIAPDALLAQARKQADSGHLEEALAMCREHLTRSGPSADMYSLMGVIQQARHERAEAVTCFQRALYLDPNHRDSLMHLMLLYQEQGGEEQAGRLRQRFARRAEGDKS
jgi:chemotaxis protein methyltransferase WspC